jgi:hypothetical protein
VSCKSKPSEGAKKLFGIISNFVVFEPQKNKHKYFEQITEKKIIHPTCCSEIFRRKQKKNRVESHKGILTLRCACKYYGITQELAMMDSRVSKVLSLLGV